jgi:hypothetical protein
VPRLYITGWPVSPSSRSGQAGPETFEGRKRLLPLRNACPMPVTSSSPSLIQPINLPAAVRQYESHVMGEPATLPCSS